MEASMARSTRGSMPSMICMMRFLVGQEYGHGSWFQELLHGIRPPSFLLHDADVASEVVGGGDGVGRLRASAAGGG
ncbi:hypothetical protein DAI22_10g137301 [Oryza sativa Japonica Group]|nr:hypothetical protein DAI22_10g137301 [Oryza sativa Japonica Group]